MIDLSEVGAFPSATATGFHVRFGLYLPGVHSTNGFDVLVRVIHSADRFDPTVPTTDFPLTWQTGTEYDLWTATVDITPNPATRFGAEGKYLYRYQLGWTPAGGTRQVVTLWFTDPFARQTDVGRLSAFELANSPKTFAWTDAAYKTPELDDLIVYELEVEQFNDTFDGLIDRLPYLQSLGVNCLELMPVTTVKLDFDWGYGPLNYFAPSARTGGPDGLKRLVDACHNSNVAVILDVVYQHVDPEFTYNMVYSDINSAPGAPRVPSPMIGGNGPFGPQCDFNQQFTQQYFAIANQQWLDNFHVDGFRYDEVTDLYAGPTDDAYAKLAYDTYRYSLNIPRFVPDPAGYSRLIQSAEALGKAPDVLRNTYTNCAWQNDLLGFAESIASGNAVTADFAHTLDPFFGGKYPDAKTVVNAAGVPVDMPVAPFQYLNSHDHPFLIVFTGTTSSDFLAPGDRGNFARLQPLTIALYTCQGVPMLWEGEEFVEDYNLPDSGTARINWRRDTHWEYFYDEFGIPMIRLCRRLGQMRRANRALRSRQSFYYYRQSLQSSQLVAYHRHAPATPTSAEQYAMIVLNFGAAAGTIDLPFPKAGTWTEALDADTLAGPITIHIPAANATRSVTVPSHYGYVFLL